jgi:hypothetical protein
MDGRGWHPSQRNNGLLESTRRSKENKGKTAFQMGDANHLKPKQSVYLMSNTPFSPPDPSLLELYRPRSDGIACVE